jgi:hypothetical protein
MTLVQQYQLHHEQPPILQRIAGQGTRRMPEYHPHQQGNTQPDHLYPHEECQQGWLEGDGEGPTDLGGEAGVIEEAGVDSVGE